MKKRRKKSRNEEKNNLEVAVGVMSSDGLGRIFVSSVNGLSLKNQYFSLKI